VIFVPGCDFRCPFCHNAALVKNRRLTLIEEKQIFADLEKRKKWVDGLVITGGEPTLQLDLPEFLKKCQKLGFKTMIETNGSRPEVIAKLLVCRIVDYLAMDLKGPLDEYEKYTKVQFQTSKIKSSVERILESGIDFEFRTTVVPGLHDQMTLLKMAGQMEKIVGGRRLSTDSCRWFLQNFQPKNCLDPEYKKKKPFGNQEMEGFLKAVKRIFSKTELRGI